MFGGYRWAHARPSVVCCGASTGPIQKFIFSALNSIWAHSRHLQNICTLGPQWAHMGFHKHDGTFADGLSHYHRDFLVSLCAAVPLFPFQYSPHSHFVMSLQLVSIGPTCSDNQENSTPLQL